jgi:uncharacterized membrane protein
MLRYLTAYVCTAFILFPIDLIWIGGIAKNFYRDGLGSLMAERPNIAVAVAFYVLYVVGLVLFVVGPALTANAWRQAAMWGALFGFFAYATYDLTNLATLQGFPARVAVVDMIWGTVLSCASCTGGFFLSRFVLEKLGAAN